MSTKHAGSRSGKSVRLAVARERATSSNRVDAPICLDEPLRAFDIKRHGGEAMASTLPGQPIDDSDMADLAWLAVAGSPQELRIFLARLVRRYRRANPRLAARLEASLVELRRRHGEGILRSPP